MIVDIRLLVAVVVNATKHRVSHRVMALYGFQKKGGSNKLRSREGPLEVRSPSPLRHESPGILLTRKFRIPDTILGPGEAHHVEARGLPLVALLLDLGLFSVPASGRLLAKLLSCEQGEIRPESHARLYHLFTKGATTRPAAGGQPELARCCAVQRSLPRPEPFAPA